MTAVADRAVLEAVSPHHSVTVQAAAGTGKTWLLVHRILRLLIEGVTPDGILAITFTRKAAREIGQRVGEELRRLADLDDASLDQRLGELGVAANADSRGLARGLYESLLTAERPLRTTTFHAFCQELLLRFPLDAEVPAEFELVENTAEPENDAWRALRRTATRSPDSALAHALDRLLQRLGPVNTRQVLADFLHHRSDWWALTEDAADPLAVVEPMGPAAAIPDLQTLYRTFFADAGLSAQLRCYQQWQERIGTKTAFDHVERLQLTLDVELPPEQRFHELFAVLLTDKAAPRSFKLRQDLQEQFGQEAVDTAMRLHDELAAAVLALRDRILARELLDTSRAWYRCGAELLDHYQSIKRRGGMLDFSDLEWQAYRLLTRSGNASWIQFKLDRRIDHVLVDEFQDTNPTQWQLLRPLLEEILAGDPERQRSVFLVGDIKQSIYGFRRAEPGLLQAAEHWLDQHGATLRLARNHSWRSSPAIIDFVNLVFDPGGDGPQLPGFIRHDTNRRELWGAVELLPLVTAENAVAAPAGAGLRDPLTVPRRTDEDLRYQQEAAQIADRIRAMIGSAVDADPVRPLRYGDILILLRDRGHAHAYEEGLRLAGIPYTGAGRGTLLECLESQDVLDLLRVLVAPFDDLALTSTLRSPVFDVLDEDLAWLATLPHMHWRDRLGTALQSQPARPALQRAATLLQQWLEMVDRIPVHDLLDRIYLEGNLLARYQAAAPAHLRQRIVGNLNRLLELALEMDSGRYPSLNHFVEQLRRLRASPDAAPDEPPAADPDRVRIMTIHAAKGLEAAVVFLADAARPPRDPRGYRAYVDWPAQAQRPAGMYLIARKDEMDRASEARAATAANQLMLEQNNLLYVAITRARQMLFISGVQSRKTGLAWYGQIRDRLAVAEEVPGLTHEWVEQAGAARQLHSARLAWDRPPALPQAGPDTPSAAMQVNPELSQPLPTGAGAASLRPSDADGDEAGVESIEATERGTLIHALLDALTADAAGDVKRTQLKQQLAQLYPGVTNDRFEDAWREACAVLDAPQLDHLFNPERFDSARNEVSILYRHGQRSVYGVIDRLIHAPDSVRVVDYKTDSGIDAASAVAQAGRHAGQLLRYVEGVRRLWPQARVSATVVFTCCAQAVDIATD